MADLQTLRRAYRSAGSEGDSIHLSEDRWERLACDELSPQERETVLDHILSCPQCSEIHRALGVLRAGATSFDPGAPEPAGSTVPRTLLPRNLWGGVGLLAAAAAVTLAVVLPTFNPDAPDTGQQVLRSAGESASATPVSPVDDEVAWQAEAGIVLRWTLDAAAPAMVEILDADGELVWSSPETTETEITWSPELPPEPGLYYWLVMVTSAGDEKVRSDLVTFELTASPP
jgi:hypothetical protein